MVDQAPQSAWVAMHPLAVQGNIPDALWEYIAHYETGGFPSSLYCPAQGRNVDYIHWIGDGPQWGGYSYGMFQMHVGDGNIYSTTNGQGNTALQALTGHGAPWTTQERTLLLDNNVQAKYGMPKIISAWNSLKGSYDGSVGWWQKYCSASGHPGGWPGNVTTDQYVTNIMPLIQSGRYGTLSKNQGNTDKSGGSSVQTTIPATTPGKKAWFKFPRVDNIGAPDPYGGFPKPDSNIQIPAGYPITALLPGTVTAVTHGVSYGAVVTIKFDNPPATNPGAPYMEYEHLRSDVQVKVGQHVYSSQIIAYNGSEQAEGAQKVPLGFGLYAGPSYGQGSAWAVTQAAITTTYNPVNLLNQAAQGKLAGCIDPETGGVGTEGSGGSGSSASGTSSPFFAGGLESYIPLLAQAHATLTNHPGFYGMCLTVDEVEQFPGWINLTDNYAVAPGVQIPDPIGLMRSAGATVMDNFTPFILRASIVSFGVLLLVALILKAIEGSGALQSAGQLVALAG
jgi:Peptidase family M23